MSIIDYTFVGTCLLLFAMMVVMACHGHRLKRLEQQIRAYVQYRRQRQAQICQWMARGQSREEAIRIVDWIEQGIQDAKTKSPIPE